MARQATPANEPDGQNDLTTSKFKLAWAKVAARAAFDEAFRNRVMQDPVAVFAEYDFSTSRESELREYVASHLQPALDAIELQQTRQETTATTTETSGRSVPCYPCTGTVPQPGIPCWMGGVSPAGPGAMLGAAQPCTAIFQPCVASAATDMGLMRSNCWGTAGTIGSLGSFCGTAGTGGTGGTYGCGGGAQSTQLAGAATGGMATSGGGMMPGGTDMGMMRSNCWGTAATIGSAGSFCGTAGTAGTGGTYGCGGGAQSTQLAGAATGGMATSGGGMMPDGTDMGMMRSNCFGSIGTAGCFGSVCGSAGSAGTVGTYGSAVTSQQNAMGAATGAMATSGGGMMPGGTDMGMMRSNCWGTAATIGSAGSFCGTAGTAGTGGTYGCGGGAQSTQLAGAATGGMATSGMATSGGGMMPGGTDMGMMSNCRGSIGTAGCFGSVCGTAGSAGTVGTYGSAVTSQQNAMGAATGGMATSGGGMMPGGTDMGMLCSMCRGTAPTMGCGCGSGSCIVATSGGTYGRGGGAQSTQLAGAATGGMATSGGGMMPGGTDMGMMSNCRGSIGTAGCFGSVCGTAGSAGTVGTYGSAVTSQQNAMGGATFGYAGPPQGADLSSGATTGSFSTYCGCIGSSGTPRPSSTAATCWGTIATGRCA